ncbi:MAG: hypothetical protein ACLFQI_02925 [Halochromatium sp.]|uniref:hypothetical protein n=1 Tax=Halochromatium sp. TaxID=2049430 RepID=UPI003979FD4D
MSKIKNRGRLIRQQAKELVLDFFRSKPECKPKAEGITQAQIFRECGFDWGEYPKATSSNQQYWVIAILRALESEGKVEQVRESGPWRLKETMIYSDEQ